MNRIYKLLLILVASLTLVSCTKTTSIRHTNDFKSKFDKSSEMVAIPSMARSYTLEANGKKKRNHNYEYVLESILDDVVKDKLSAKGYRIKSLRKSMAHEMGISADMLRLQEASVLAASNLYKVLLLDVEKAENIDVKISGNHTKIKDAMSSNIAVILEYTANNKTTGAMIKNILLNRYVSALADNTPDEHSSLRILFIDLESQKVLWSNVFSVQSTALASMLTRKSNEQIDKDTISFIFDHLLKELPNR